MYDWVLLFCSLKLYDDRAKLPAAKLPSSWSLNDMLLTSDSVESLVLVSVLATVAALLLLALTKAPAPELLLAAVVILVLLCTVVCSCSWRPMKAAVPPPL